MHLLVFVLGLAVAVVVVVSEQLIFFVLGGFCA